MNNVIPKPGGTNSGLRSQHMRAAVAPADIALEDGVSRGGLALIKVGLGFRVEGQSVPREMRIESSPYLYLLQALLNMD